MKSRSYNIFLFLSTLTRGLVSVFSLVLLYKMGYSFKNILYFLFILYSIGILVNYLSLRVHYKIVLVLSSLIYGFSFIYLLSMETGIINLSIFAVMLSFGEYSYHAMRHYLALVMLEDNKKKSINLVLITYLGIIISSLIGMLLIEKLSNLVTSIIIFIMSFISLLPVLKKDCILLNRRDNDVRVSIPFNKIIFNVMEQFKVLFLELQPLFLYIYIDSSIYYVGIFNIVINIASLLVLYFFSRIFLKKYFKYYCLILGLIFILKLNVGNRLFLLGVAFFEGIFVKIYERYSLENLYDYGDNCIFKYLLVEEFIFFSTKSLIILLYWLFNLDFIVIMYINVLGVVVSGFFLNKKRNIKG